MKIEIEVISTEIISPSSPTPNNVSNYRLSFLDQKSPSILMPYILFYKATTSPFLTKSEISSRLKKSLSKTLSLYYPLAGRIVGNTHVNCNDQGITYVEALADCELFEVINKPVIAHELEKLILPENLVDNIDTDFCFIAQTTFFKCGGMAIGFALSHKLGDAWTRSVFINNWAAISRGDDANIQSPIFDGATLFPPRSDFDEFNRNLIMGKEVVITKRFMFTSTKINELRDIYTDTTRATRIEALTAFIWTRLMLSTQTKDDLTKIFTMLSTQTKDDLTKIFTIFVVVSLRKWVVPPLPDGLVGNFFDTAVVVPSLVDGEEGTYGVVEKLREAIGLIRERSKTLDPKNDKAKKFAGGGEMVPFYFTSHCRFSLYEADFGWGKPVWIGSGRGRFKNLVTFMDSVSEGGIEAWITLKLEDMAKFEVDGEFLAYASTSLPDVCS